MTSDPVLELKTDSEAASDSASSSVELKTELLINFFKKKFSLSNFMIILKCFLSESCLVVYFHSFGKVEYKFV